MNYAQIKYCDIANGPGVRTSLFVSGCTRHCPGCFNEVAQNFGYGDCFDDAVQDQIIESLKPDYITGLTILGGEPMEPENQHALLPFLRRVRQELPDKTIWCYSGYEWDDLAADYRHGRARTPETLSILTMLDVLVDGPYIEKLHGITLRFRGSSNQRLLDVKMSLSMNRPVWWEDEEVYAHHGM